MYDIAIEGSTTALGKRESLKSIHQRDAISPV
jgi:hypothetical protein